MSTSDLQAQALVERDEELALLRKLALGTMAGRAAVVEIAGPPGVGRSTLLDAAVAHARSAGLKALFARGSPAEVRPPRRGRVPAPRRARTRLPSA